MTSALEALARGAASILRRPLADTERGKFSKYMEQLIKWQRVHRLVGSVDPLWIVEHLFLDSLLFLRLLPETARAVLDLGSGAGLPGLPIKIVRRDLDVTLVESRRRRASFLSTVARELELDGLNVVAGRVEDHLPEFEGHFNAVVMRCAGDVDEMIPLASRLLCPGGIAIVAGPPRATALALGDWVTVDGWSRGKSRRFALYRNG